MISHAHAIELLGQRLSDGARRQPTVPGHRAAAVAVLLLDRGGTTYVPFTVRSGELAKHSGQISFPGGKLDASDTSLAACALRETHEELGVDPRGARVLGYLDDVLTPTGYTIRPVVAELDAAAAVYAPNPGEVQAVFERPLALFADPSIREELGEREHNGVSYRLHAYHVGFERAIWGATARILEQLVDVLLDR